MKPIVLTNKNAFSERVMSREEVLRREQEMYALEQVREQIFYSYMAKPFSKEYQSVDPRRRKEIADSGQIREDRNCVANLPHEHIAREWNQTGFYTNPYNHQGKYMGKVDKNIKYDKTY